MGGQPGEHPGGNGLSENEVSRTQQARSPVWGPPTAQVQPGTRVREAARRGSVRRSSEMERTGGQ